MRLGWLLLCASACRSVALPVAADLGAPDLACLGPLNACGQCGPTPIEICNGRDDNCDGVIDEGCVRRLDDRQGYDAARVRLSGTLAAYDERVLLPYGYPASVADIGYIDPRGGAHQSTMAEAVGDLGAPDVRYDSGDTDGDWLVWRVSDAHGAVIGVEAMRVANGARTLLPQPALGWPPEIVVHDGRALFGVQNGAGLDLLSWELNTHTLTTLVGGVYSSPLLAAQGDWVVYVTSAGKPQLTARNLTTNEVTLLADATYIDSVDLDGTRLVWGDNVYDATTKMATRRVHHVDLASGRPPVTFVDDLHARHPRVSGGVVCLIASDGGVWAYDLGSGRRLRVASSGSRCDVSIGVSGRRVVWIAPSVAAYPYASEAGFVYVRDLAADEP